MDGTGDRRAGRWSHKAVAWTPSTQPSVSEQRPNNRMQLTGRPSDYVEV